MWNQNTKIFSVVFVPLEIKLFVNSMTSQMNTEVEKNQQ